MSDINLLPPEIRVLEKKGRYVKYSRIAGVVCLAVGCLFMTVSVILYLVTKQSVATSNTKLTGLQSDIGSNKTLEDSLANLTAKYQALSAIFKTRQLYSKLLDSLGKLVPSEVHISEINVLSKDKINLSGNSLGYLSLASFVKALEDPAKSSIFEKPVLNSVTLNSQSGQVQFVLEIGIKAGGLLL